MVNPNCAEHRKIKGNVSTTVSIGEARWSPDGNYVTHCVRARTPFYSGYIVDRIAINTVDMATFTSVRVSGTLSANSTYWIDDLVWSPDSTRIAYPYREDSTSRLREAYIAIAGQTAQQTRVRVPIVTNQGVLFRLYWSDDSRYLLYSVTGSVPGSLYTHDTLNMTSRNATKISGDLVSGGNVNTFAWSLDNSRVAYIANQDVDTVDELYSALPDVSDSSVKLSDPPVMGGGVESFQWSSNSERIGYVADQETDNVSEAYTVNTSGGGSSVKVSPEPIGVGNNDNGRINWSPDGLKIAFQMVGDDAGLYVTSPDNNSQTIKVSGGIVGTNSTVSFSNSREEYFNSLLWTPDSFYLIYKAYIDGPGALNGRLYRSAFDETGVTAIN